MLACLERLSGRFQEKAAIKEIISRPANTLEEKKAVLTDLKNIGGEKATSEIYNIITSPSCDDELFVHGVEAIRDTENALNRVFLLMASLGIEALQYKQGRKEGPTHEDAILDAMVHIGKTTKEPKIETAGECIHYWGEYYYPEQAKKALADLNAAAKKSAPKCAVGA